MKKNYLWMAAIASMLSFTACNDDASSINNGENLEELVMDEGTTLELAISNTGIGTRATRPLGSSAAANNVTEVQLKFYKKVATEWQEDKTITAHKAGSKNQDDPYAGNKIPFTHEGKEGIPGNVEHIEEKIKVRLNGLAPKTEYRIVAYGYNSKFPYGAITDDKGLLSVASTNGVTEYQLEEVFAGYVEKTTKEGEAKFNAAPVVTITRQVAGILAYFKIPTHANGEVVKTVKVIANAKSAGFKFPNKLMTANTAFNGIGTTEPQIGDGTKEPKKGEVLMEFDMETAATNWNKGEPTGDYYTTNVNGKTDNEAPTASNGLATRYVAPTGLKLKADAFFGARYILPYDKHITTLDNQQTLRVVMYNKDGAVLKILKVTTAENTKPTDGTIYNYDIRCNNFYSIGKKMATGSTDGKDPNPDPDKPGKEDPDDPIDLGSTDQIVVEINDAWEVLHNMGVEE